MFLTLLILVSSCLLNTINARLPGSPRLDACFLPDTSEEMKKSLEGHHDFPLQINIITCQPHEACMRIRRPVNIGEVQLG